MTVVLLVVGILVLVGGILAAVLIPTLRRMQRGSDAFTEAFLAQAAASGETILAGPEAASYRGGTGSHSTVKGNGTLVLTDRRLVFRKLSGGEVEIPRAAITGIREEASFLGSRVGGQTCLVVETDEPAEVGFFVTDIARWRTLLP